ncbi:MAG: LD-carboxypeptidase [Pseudomonadota bacterium]
MSIKNSPWPFLKKGDIVDIIAPSSGVPTNDLHKYYRQVKEVFEKIGLIARIPDDLIEIGQDLFSANSLDYRANHLIYALTNDESKAVWAIRGGYGAAKIIPYLEKISNLPQSKIVLGFSDITALHLFLNNKWNWNSIHSAVLNQIIQNENFIAELEPILFGKQEKIIYDQLIPLNKAASQVNEISAPITGGNLAIVQTSIGTSWEMQSKEKIVFLEDVGEEGYRIDRMLNHLEQASLFEGVKAIIFGEITPPKNIFPETCESAINNFASKIDIPVFSLPIIGHNIKHNSPLPLGTACKLSALGDNKFILECETGGYDADS